MNVFAHGSLVIVSVRITADSYANDNNYANVLIMSKLIPDAVEFASTSSYSSFQLLVVVVVCPRHLFGLHKFTLTISPSSTSLTLSSSFANTAA